MKNESNRIPSREECCKLMAQYSMLPNIAKHSVQVMHVSLAITDNLESGLTINRDLVIAAALLHDITKTRSIETKERHAMSGGILLRELGFTDVAEIVEQHVHLENINKYGKLEEKEIVYYADKRVMHDHIVTVEERLRDLAQRYGSIKEIKNLIFESKEMIVAIERKIAGFMKIDLQQVIQRV
jgi:putative nucleotidyltransferase with HDIG domain